MSLPLCPCGVSPVVRDWHPEPDVVVWCECDPMVFDTVDQYLDWLTRPNNFNPELNRKNSDPVLALPAMEAKT